jgi:hypothetical protein
MAKPIPKELKDEIIAKIKVESLSGAEAAALRHQCQKHLPLVS